MWLFLFLTTSLNAFSLNRTLLRDISSQNNLVTEHFHIYWSENYNYTYPWLDDSDANGYPLYIDTLTLTLEELYQSFVKQGFDMPPRIEIYIANTGITAESPYMPTNSLATLGAFTSDIYPEILITADIAQKTLSNDMKTILAHEMMHAVHYQYEIIEGEDTTPPDIMWFTEGTSVASEYILSGDIMDKQWYMSDLMSNINSGLFSQNGVVDYANGFMFLYLHKKYGYSLKDFVDMFKLYNTPKTFLEYIAQQNNTTADDIVTDIYNSFFYEKNLYGGIMESLEIEPVNSLSSVEFGGVLFENYDLNITSSWQLISLPVDTNDFSFLDNGNNIIWGYKDSNWVCSASDEELSSQCDILYPMSYIGKSDGLWIKSDINSTYSLKLFR